MRILITGVTGLLGIALQQFAKPSDDLFGIYYPSRALPSPLRAATRVANVSDLSAMLDIFDWAKPDVVIHAAAIGSVDFAERNREQTRMVNVIGTQVVVDLCRSFNAQIIYISSNAVFDGKAPLYSETDPVSPVNYYGQLKVEAESLVRDSDLAHAIVRPILMYGWTYPGERSNLVTNWVHLLREGKKVKVVDNVYSKPLPVWSCAAVVWNLIGKNKHGVYHVAGADRLSLYQFALATAHVFELDPTLIEPVPDSHFTEIAQRPRDTSFDTSKMEHELGIQPISVESGLRQMKKMETFLKYGT